MPDLEPLDALVAAWRSYLKQQAPPPEMSRSAGFIAGVLICADQLAATIERMKAGA